MQREASDSDACAEIMTFTTLEILSLLDTLVHLYSVDFVAFLLETTVVRNVLFPHSVACRVCFLEKSPSRMDVPQITQLSHAIAQQHWGVTAGTSQQRFPFPWLLWPSIFGLTGSSCRKVSLGGLLSITTRAMRSRRGASSLSPILFSLPGIPSFSFLPPFSSFPSLSSLHALVLTLPALHSWQSLPTVIRTKDVGVVDCCPPKQPADPFTRTWTLVLG